MPDPPHPQGPLFTPVWRLLNKFTPEDRLQGWAADQSQCRMVHWGKQFLTRRGKKDQLCHSQLADRHLLSLPSHFEWESTYTYWSSTLSHFCPKDRTDHLDLSTRVRKEITNQYIHWFQEWIPGASCPCCHMERKGITNSQRASYETPGGNSRTLRSGSASKGGCSHSLQGSPKGPHIPYKRKNPGQQGCWDNCPRTARLGLPLGLGPEAKTPSSQCRGLRFNAWSGNQIPHAATKSSHAVKDSIWNN